MSNYGHGVIYMMKKFYNFNDVIMYMTKNKYPQNIINNIIIIANKREFKNNVNCIQLYDDIIEIYTNDFEIITYLLDLML